jgi:hypothetical protein
MDERRVAHQLSGNGFHNGQCPETGVGPEDLWTAWNTCQPDTEYGAQLPPCNLDLYKVFQLLQSLTTATHAAVSAHTCRQTDQVLSDDANESRKPNGRQGLHQLWTVQGYR